MKRGWRGWAAAVTILVAAGLVAACGGNQVHKTSSHEAIALQAGDLERGGIALITPSTVTGQEEDKQELALVFNDVMRRERPNIRFVSLSETLGDVNRAGIAVDYRRMFEHYRDTGMFTHDALANVSRATDAQYIGQLKLADFRQDSQSRFGVFGIRLLQTKVATIRLFFQVWDARSGTVAWEGVQEVTRAYDTGSEQPITFRAVVEEAATNLVAQLP
jgi:hypothetical protein